MKSNFGAKDKRDLSGSVQSTRPPFGGGIVFFILSMIPLLLEQRMEPEEGTLALRAIEARARLASWLAGSLAGPWAG